MWHPIVVFGDPRRQTPSRDRYSRRHDTCFAHVSPLPARVHPACGRAFARDKCVPSASMCLRKTPKDDRGRDTPPTTLITQVAVRMAVKTFKFHISTVIVHVSMRCARMNRDICRSIIFLEFTAVIGGPSGLFREPFSWSSRNM